MTFEEYFNSNLPRVDSFHPHFNDALAWILRAGGKHFRAKLLLGAASALNPNLNIETAYPVAMAVELLHTYSLIHDDLPAMDNADLRRGVETLHVRYDEVTAILAGDALNTHAFYVLSHSNLKPEVIVECVQILSAAGGLFGMVVGQALDCYFENQKLNLEQVKFLHLHKTGALIAASLQMGAIVAGADEVECEKAREIGLKLGLAFQIHDDILDATASEAQTGKPVRNDETKNSFTNLLGVAGAIAARDELKREIISNLNDSPLAPLVQNLMNTYLKG